MAAGASHIKSSSSLPNLGNNGSGFNLKPSGLRAAGPSGSLGSAGLAASLAVRRLRTCSGIGSDEEDEGSGGSGGSSSRFRPSSGSCSSGTGPLEELPGNGAAGRPPHVTLSRIIGTFSSTLSTASWLRLDSAKSDPQPDPV